MAKRPVKKKRQPDYQQVARKVLDTVAPDAEPKAIKPAKTPPRPKGKQDAEDIDRAAGEGMAQPQAKPKKNPAAVALGRKGGLKGGKARAAKLSKEQRSESARKAAKARWEKEKGEA